MACKLTAESSRDNVGVVGLVVTGRVRRSPKCGIWRSERSVWY